MDFIYCACCELEVDQHEWDLEYSRCHQCAFCASLEHFPCCHGGCVKHVDASLDRRLELAERRRDEREEGGGGGFMLDPVWRHYHDICERLYGLLGLAVLACA